MSKSFQFRCHQCETGLWAEPDMAGLSCNCPTCATALTVPVSRALVLAEPDIPVLDLDDLIDVEEPARPVQWNQGRREPSTTPVEMRLPGQLGGLKVNVDQKTSNTIATTFLGGLLVAIGAVLFAMFGGKHRA